MNSEICHQDNFKWFPLASSFIILGIFRTTEPLSMAQDVTFHEIVKFPNLQVQ